MRTAQRIGDPLGTARLGVPRRVLFLLAIGGVLLALLPASSAAGPERLLVHSWQSEDGLPSNAIRAVAQAADGYFWIATAEGVVRFAGTLDNGPDTFG